MGLFLFLTVVISLSGVMAPGPVFAATVAKGYGNKNAGALIALGHGIIELPLIAAIYLGLKTIFTNPAVSWGISIGGGLVLIYMGYGMIKLRNVADERGSYLPYPSVLVGVITTATNPYFFAWWGTVGAALVSKALDLNPWVVVLFGVVHWLCDLGWGFFVSLTVFKTKHLWGKRVQGLIFKICGLLMLGFGAWFILDKFI
ncbi:LysE family transporter [candidate division KSB1 bacterium]|nr:LysE family transporter [candidate division KSB1 bacterium]